MPCLCFGASKLDTPVGPAGVVRNGVLAALAVFAIGTPSGSGRVATLGRWRVRRVRDGGGHRGSSRPLTSGAAADAVADGDPHVYARGRGGRGDAGFGERDDPGDHVQ